MSDKIAAAGYPKVCSSCGQPIRTSKQNHTTHHENGQKYAWHNGCPPPWKENPRKVG